MFCISIYRHGSLKIVGNKLKNPIIAKYELEESCSTHDTSAQITSVPCTRAVGAEAEQSIER